MNLARVEIVGDCGLDDNRNGNILISQSTYRIVIVGDGIRSVSSVS